MSCVYIYIYIYIICEYEGSLLAGSTRVYPGGRVGVSARKIVDKYAKKLKD